MTGLYINGQKVDLPIGLNLSLILENPVYTKNGTYTLDLELSLLTDRNARVYELINRFNKAEDIIDKRSAILIVDGEVILNGTEDIQGWTTQKVKIVLMSGNSELNFLIGGDRKLRSLSLGEAEPIVGIPEEGESQFRANARAVLERLERGYPAYDFQLLPYSTGEDTDPNKIYEGGQYGFAFGNFYNVATVNSIGTSIVDEPTFSPYYSGQVPQPYFCFIIKRIVESLGYTMLQNDLANHWIWKDSYIVHGIQTMKYAKMLPGWTVNEFFSKIEFQFDCVFIIDEETKGVKLVFKYNTQQQYQDIVTIEPLNEPETDIDEENREDPRISNVAYSLDSEDYYKFMYMDRGFIDLVEKYNNYIIVDSFSELWTKVTDNTDVNRFKKIFRYKGAEFVAFNTGIEQSGSDKIVPIKVNSFKPLYNNPEPDYLDIDKELDIIPAAMTKTSYYYEHKPGWMKRIYAQIAVAGNYDSLRSSETEPQNEDDYNLQDLIEGTDSLESESGYSKMRLAIYGGLLYYFNPEEDTRMARFPTSYVENLLEEYSVTGKERYINTNAVLDPFRLSNINDDIYEKAVAIDTTTTYKFNFIYHKKIDIMSKFIINNRAYVCKKLERIVTINGFNDLIEGEFYLLKD